VPSRPACAAAEDNCLASGCCKTSGHKCFLKTQEKAFCNETCHRGLCTLAPNDNHAMPAFQAGTSLYCFEVYTANTGSTKVSTELDLIKRQCSEKKSVFACDAYSVFADVPKPYGDCNAMVAVPDTLNEFHLTKRKKSGSWVNWGLFYQVWVKIRDLGLWQAHDWTIKVDPDAVFAPAKMKAYLATKMVTNNGVYLENCKSVDSGFFGNTEVISRTGVVGLTEGLEHCHATFAECAKTGCDWKWGPWGEDVFVQRCLDEKHVDKVEAFDLTSDGKCGADRPAGQKHNESWTPDCSKVTTPVAHPFKKPEDYFDCLAEMTEP